MYDLYKPFRNRLRTMSLMPSLLGLYQFVQFVQFNKPLPKELHYPRFGLTTPRDVGLHEWTLELLVREIILNAPGIGKRALTTWNEFAAIANLARTIEDETWGRVPNGQAMIEYELVRIAHRQFPWQIRPDSRHVASYFKLYSNPRLASLMAETYGMAAVEFFQLALSLVGYFLDRPVLRAPAPNQMNTVPQAVVDRMVSRMSISLDDLRKCIGQRQAYNVNWAYLFDPLRTWPMIDIGNNKLFCPMPTLLFWRLTEGLYFDLVQHRHAFDRNFGLAFQDLVGEVVTAACQGRGVKLFAEERYGTKKRPRDSVDWIIQDGDGTVFLECKASRLKAQAKVDLNDTATIDGEVDRLASFVVQLYSTMEDARAGAYRQWQPDDKPVYPLVVTLDEWLPSGRALSGRLEEKVREGLQQHRVPTTVLESHPFTLCSLYEFEATAKAFSSAGIQAVMGQKIAGEHQGWAMMPFLQRFFPQAVTDRRVLFDAERQTIFKGLAPVL